MDLCRAKGVISYEGPIPLGQQWQHADALVGKLLFGPPAPTAKELARKAVVDPQADKRAHYCNLLGRTYIDDLELANLPDGV